MSNLASMGALVGALSNTGEAVAQSNAYRGQAQFTKEMADLNASYGNLQATDALERGKQAADQTILRTRAIQGAQRAAAGASGVDPNVGSALDLQADTGFLGELDALTIKNNAAREALGLRSQALSQRLQGRLGYLAGTNAARNTLITGGMNFVRGGMRAAYLQNRYGGLTADKSALQDAYDKGLISEAEYKSGMVS